MPNPTVLALVPSLYCCVAGLGCKTAKRPSCSGGALVDVMEPVQHRSRPDRTSRGAWLRFRCLQSKRPMRALAVVVRDVFGQHGSEMLLIQDNQVVEALAA